MASLPMAVLLGWLAAASVAGFSLAVVDKDRARRGRSRVPERVLWGLALLGGWPGEALAFVAVRHKTRKAAFLVPFIVCVVANVVLLWAVWRSGWLTP